MFTPPFSFRLTIALLLCAAPLTHATAALQGCPATCANSGASVQTGSSCAVVVSEVLQSTAGSAGDTCIPSCTTCRSVVRFTWDLSGCVDELVEWTQQSYDASNEAQPSAHGDSAGNGSVRQSVTSPCSGTQAQFVLNVGGLQQLFTLDCGCGV